MLFVVCWHSASISRPHQECIYQAVTMKCGWPAQYNCDSQDSTRQNEFLQPSCSFREQLKLRNVMQVACAGIQRGIVPSRGACKGWGLTLPHDSTVRTIRAGFHQHRNEVVKCGKVSNIDQWEINLDSHWDGIVRFPGRIQVLIKPSPFSHILASSLPSLLALTVLPVTSAWTSISSPVQPCLTHFAPLEIPAWVRSHPQKVSHPHCALLLSTVWLLPQGIVTEGRE